MEIFGALIAGTFIGSVLGFVGAGGAMLAVPILIYGFGFEPSVASTAALAVVGAAALSGASAKIKTKQIYYRDAVVIWAIGLTTNIGFSSIVHTLSEDFIAIGFSLVIIFAGLSMLGSPLTTIHKRMSWPVLIGISLLIGSITGLFGIGGGFLVIPVLVLGFGTSHVIAAGTALLVIAMNSATALLGHNMRCCERSLPTYFFPSRFLAWWSDSLSPNDGPWQYELFATGNPTERALRLGRRVPQED